MRLVDLLGLGCYTVARRYIWKRFQQNIGTKRKEIAMKTKTFTLSIASLAILSLLAACGPKEQASTQPSAQ